MSGTLATLLIVVLVATVGVLLLGLFSMARGGEFNRKYGNKLMRFRVLFQALAILLFIILMFTLSR